MATPINVVSGIEDAFEANDDKAIHLLMIGKPYVGKSTLVNVLVHGKSTEGNAGPKAAKPLEPTTSVVHGLVYKVYDTQGIQLTTNKDETIKKMKMILSNKFCIVVVCFRWDSRFNDECMKILEVINSLSNDIWNKVIIALTHSDVLSPDWIGLSDEKINDEIILKNKEWNNELKKALSNFNVNDELVNEFKICNTSHTKIRTEHLPHLLNWYENLVHNVVNVFEDCPCFRDVVKPCKVEKKSEHTYSIGDIVYTIAPASHVSAGGGTVLGAITDRVVSTITGAGVGDLLCAGLGIILTAAIFFYFKKTDQEHVLIILHKLY